MTGGISFKKSHLRAVAAVAVVLGAGLIAAAPARADHDGGPDIGFHFFFGFPVPFFVPPPPPPPPAVYYYQPPPQIVYRDRPYYRSTSTGTITGVNAGMINAGMIMAAGTTAAATTTTNTGTVTIATDARVAQVICARL